MTKFSLTALTTFAFASLSQAALIGHWEFEEGTGTVAADSSTLGNDGTITGATWGSDEVRDSYLIFDGTFSYVDPMVTLPVMTDSNDFTWAVWVNSQEAIGATQQNAIIIGNRNDATGTDFAPRQFIKITPTKFEWHQNGGGADNLDVPDLEVGAWHHIAVVKTGTNLEYFFDGTSVGTKSLGEVIGAAAHPFYMGGQANNASVNEYFNGYLDDVRIYDEALTASDINMIIGSTNLPPKFVESPFAADDATVSTAYTATISGSATDPNVADTVAYSKIEGPDWLTVAPDGSLSGTPGAADAGFSHVTIQASDGLANVVSTLVVPVIDPNAPPTPDGLFGHWPLNDGAGDIAADTSGNHFNAFITNSETGGLALDGSVWIEDPEFGTVLSFNGTNVSGAHATVGVPPIYGLMPGLTLENDFTWSVWTNSDQEEAAPNDLILGNRYDVNGADYNPREFIKFTSTKFEFDTNANQGIDYDDLPLGTWVHNVIVKDGSDLTYYRDGEVMGSSFLGQVPVNNLPVYFGGFGGENWRGSLSDIRMYERALSAEEVSTLYQIKVPDPNETIVITDFTVADNLDITLTWSSRLSALYLLDVSTGMTDEGQPGGWQNIDDAIPSGGDSTSYLLPAAQFPNAATMPKLFFRVRKVVPGE